MIHTFTYSISTSQLSAPSQEPRWPNKKVRGIMGATIDGDLTDWYSRVIKDDLGRIWKVWRFIARKPEFYTVALGDQSGQSHSIDLPQLLDLQFSFVEDPATSRADKRNECQDFGHSRPLRPCFRIYYDVDVDHNQDPNSNASPRCRVNTRYICRTERAVSLHRVLESVDYAILLMKAILSTSCERSFRA